MERGSRIAVLMRDITKRFPGVIANDHINLTVYAGEIHALLGENGAGKSTLMNILYGLYQPDEGEIFIWGKKVKIRSPKDALKLGIGMVHQHFKLIDSLSVAENLALILREYKFLVPLNEIKRRVLELSKKYGLDIDPEAKIWQLSAGERQRIEILKVLIHGARILILDEPTTVLTPIEKEKLFKILRHMANEGHAILFITHKLEEVMELSDRVTVLRHGKVVATLETRSTNPRELAKLMIGRDILAPNEITTTSPKIVRERKIPVLEVRDLYVLNDKGFLSVKGVSFSVYPGEVFGIAGIAGHGQRELIEAILGLRKIQKGSVVLLGAEVTNSSPRHIMEKGVAYIPEDRIRTGVVPDLSVVENLILKNYWRKPFSGKLFLNMSLIDRWADDLISKYRIMTLDRKAPVKLLSGGNIQRVILARELSGNPRLIIASHPTYGLDIAATEQVHDLLIDQRNRGVAILLVSEDPEEILKLSDRIAVMFEGRFIGTSDADKISLEDIYLMMSGVRE